jgi:DNA-binding beta-propeller fold protein YncE
LSLLTYNGSFLGPRGVAVDSTGNVYVVDSNNHKIKKLASGSSTWTDITGNGSFKCPHGIEVDSSGNLYVADLLNNKIKKMTQ